MSPADNSFVAVLGSDARRAVCGESDNTVGDLKEGTECEMTLETEPCPPGTRGVELASGKACALCRAGDALGGG